MDEILLSVNQAAIILKVHQLTIRRYIKEGKLKAVRAGGNIRVPQSSINEFAKELSPISYSQKKVIEQRTATFSMDDTIFRVKGRGISLRSNI